MRQYRDNATYNSVRVHDRLEAMGDGEQSNVSAKILSQGLLDNGICGIVYIEVASVQWARSEQIHMIQSILTNCRRS